MKNIFYLSTFTALLSFCFTVSAAIRVSFLRSDAASMIKFLDDHYIDHSSLTKAQSDRLTGILIRLRGGEAYISNLHHELWWISMVGFGVITILSLVIAVLAFRAKRDT